MGKTYKKVAYGLDRKPKGHKQSKIAGVRPSAIPPTEWDGVNLDDKQPFVAARRMAAKEMSVEDISHRLNRKFRISKKRAIEIAHLAN